MQIRNFLKGKYWLWGLLFGIFAVEIIGVLFLSLITSQRWNLTILLEYYNQAFSRSIQPLIFFCLISELFFRTLKNFKKQAPNSVKRILLLLLLILFFIFFISGILITFAISFAD